MNIQPIGIIHSPYKSHQDAPRQGSLSQTESVIEVFPDYADGLKGIERSYRLVILYWGDRADRGVLQSPTPFDPTIVGVFTTRSPNRPNPIAICTVKLLSHDGNTLTVVGLDALDGSPVLDIKGYSSEAANAPE